MAALSLLTIASHHHQHASHNALRIHVSGVLARNTPALPEQRILVFSHGTRVTVGDLFGTMPVRVKQRAIEAERPSTKHWDELVRITVALLLSWPGIVAVRLRDASRGKTLFLRTNTPASMAPRGPREAVVRAARLLQQAGLSDLADLESWVPVSASAPGISVQGCISLVPVTTRRAQFLSIGIEPILDGRHSNVVLEEINRIVSQSSFGILEDGVGREMDSRRERPDGIHGATKARKGPDRWPMFYVGITMEGVLTSEVEDVLDGRRTHLATLVDLLRAMFLRFLEKHLFRPRPVQLFAEDRSTGSSSSGGARSRTPRGAPISRAAEADRVGADVLAPPNRSGRSPEAAAPDGGRGRSRDNTAALTRKQPISPFTHWARTKAGPIRDHSKTIPIGAGVDDGAGSTHDETATTDAGKDGGPGATAPRRRLVGADGALLRRPYEDFLSAAEPPTPAEKAPAAAAAVVGTDAESRGTFVWNNPITKAELLVDFRTGFVLPGRQRTTPGPHEQSIHAQGPAPLSLDPGSQGPRSEWVEEVLASWKNPVFESVEPFIPRLPDITDTLAADGSHECAKRDAGDRSLMPPGRVSKDALRRAELVAQVDQKFLLVRLPSPAPPASREGRRGSGVPGSESGLLVLVDQHAADERCRVEALLRDYFEAADGTWRARTSALENPIHFDLPTQEHELLRLLRPHFEYWGVWYEAVADGPGVPRGRGGRTGRVRVSSLPTGIAERCRLEPKLVADLLRRDAWALAEFDRSVPIPAAARTEDEKQHSWVQRLHGCPQGILELVSSRACRGK